MTKKENIIIKELREKRTFLLFKEELTENDLKELGELNKRLGF